MNALSAERAKGYIVGKYTDRYNDILFLNV